MYIKIYFNEKPVYLCNELDKEIQSVLHHPDAVFIDELSGAAIKSLLHEIQKDQFHAGVLFDPDLDKIKKAFFRNFTQVEAAGGIVQNEHKEVLFIYRLGKWDLPKGKLDPGEDPASCAIREIREETGVSHLTLKKKVGETYHTYNAYGKHYLKTTHWFYLTSKGQEKLTPQTEEDIEKVTWIKTRNIKEPVSNTYASIREILSKFFDEA